jgi:oligopeptide transport system permease protein
VIGSVFGSVAGFFGGWLDLIMMRIVDIIYTVPDILLIVLISFSIKKPLENLAETQGFQWLQILGPNLISIFLVFALLYWVGMARIVPQPGAHAQAERIRYCRQSAGRFQRSYYTQAPAHQLHRYINCYHHPADSFRYLTESFLSFLGLGVAVPLPSLGSLASDGLNGLNTYPYLLLAPALLICLIILSFNLFGDGLRDAFDPKMKS